MGRITTSILCAGANTLKQIYDKHGGKCRQWDAAFMINCRTPDSIKSRIKQDDPEIYDLFMDLRIGAAVASAFTCVGANEWADQQVLSTVKSKDTYAITTLKNDCYFDKHFPGFAAGKVANGMYTICVGESLPEPGLYYVGGKGFVLHDEYGDSVDIEGRDITTSFKGLYISKVYTEQGLFHLFEEEEKVFELLAQELEKTSQDLTWTEAISQTMIEAFDEFFSKEDAEELKTQRLQITQTF